MRTQRNRVLAAVALSSALAGVPSATVDARQQVHPAVEDLRAAVAILEEIHPNPYTRIEKREFHAAADALARDLPALPAQTAALRIAELVARIRDGHTTIGLGAPVFASDTTFPIRIEQFIDGLFVTAVRPDDHALLGARVTRLNGIPADEFWRRLATIAAGDNVFSRMADLPLRVVRPEVVSGLGLGSLHTLDIEADAGGQTMMVRMPAMSIPFAAAWYGSSFEGPAGATLSLPSAEAAARDLSYRYPAAPYWFTRDGDLLYVRINQLVNGDGDVPLGAASRAATLDEFWRAVLESVDAAPEARLVIDLRNNRGGNNAFARRFVDTLAERPGFREPGRLFVLMGRRTFSAAMNFVSQLEDRTAAVFVGEPAGGSPSHFGDAAAVTLPRSGLTLFVSTIPWSTGVSPRDVREAMEPDVPAALAFADFRDGRDPALDAVRHFTADSVLSARLMNTYRQRGIDAAVAAYRERRAASTDPDPWSSDLQQLLAFGDALIGARAEGRDIFRVFTLATEIYPESAEAWAAQGRVLAFVGQWRAAEQAYARAATLRPAQPLLARLLALARRR